MKDIRAKDIKIKLLKILKLLPVSECIGMGVIIGCTLKLIIESRILLNSRLAVIIMVSNIICFVFGLVSGGSIIKKINKKIRE